MPAGTVPPTPIMESHRPSVASLLADVPPWPMPSPTPAPIAEPIIEAASVAPIVALPRIEQITAPQPSYGQLSADEMLAVLNDTAWPAERLQEAIRVACGYGNAAWPNGESTCKPNSANGRYDGLFALDNPFWFAYCGTDGSRWADPRVNAATALCVGRYDEAHGQDFWAQWQVKP